MAQSATLPDLLVMTFNIRYAKPADGPDFWDRRRDLVFDLLRQRRPDILGMQEALASQLADLRAALPDYDALAVGREDGRSEGEHCPLFFRQERFEAQESGTFWLSDTPDEPGSRTWGNTATRICTWGRLFDRQTQRALYVYNLHLDHQSQTARDSGVRLVRERAVGRSAPDPVMILGDFNAEEENPAVRWLLAQTELALTDTFRAVHPNAEMVGTFNGFAGETTGPKIDYILTTKEFVPLEAEIVRDHWDGRYPSDHFPVTARLRLIG